MALRWIDEISEITEGFYSGAIEFENVRALLEEQRARFSRGESKDIAHLLPEYQDVMLVLDDIGAERPTEFALETLALIVEHRPPPGHADDRDDELQPKRARSAARAG